MKYLLLFSFLTINTSSATILSPLLECELKDPHLVFRLDDPQSGSLYHNDKICRFSVETFEEQNQRAGNNGYDIVFNLNDCHHADTFIQKGFLRVVLEGNNSKDVTSYILALKNHQTLTCKSSFKSAHKALVKLRKAHSQAE